ncbi:MAG: exodeoxyribonuclease VII large subunit [Deltaproteobacteria bacterium]|nr:exodeoxyribonuclease VII large subunit [Deltaproteobacteria bacterium]
MEKRGRGARSGLKEALPLGTRTTNQAPACEVAMLRQGDRERPFTVDLLVRTASFLLEEQVGVVWVEGEISSLRTPGSGHQYFVLKDEGAQLPAVMWRALAARLRFRLEDGKRFLVRGKLGIYPEQGKFQLYVEAVEPAGLGAAALALEQLKKKLLAEGLLDPARKRPLPRFPRRIGVVTSPTGAAVRDIIRVIERRFPLPILVSPTRVQGDGAALEIARAIERVGCVQGIDVVIVGRGGGSAEDLSAFNDEMVARAMAACPVPVISAVGHEIDVTLADLVADVRAATPTAAGELAVPERAVLLAELTRLEARLAREARVLLSSQRARLQRLEANLQHPARRIDRVRQRLDDTLARQGELVRGRLATHRRELAELESRLHSLHPRARLAEDHARVAELAARLHAAMRAGFFRRRRDLAATSGRLDAMSPLKVLERGYAVALTGEGRVVTDARAVQVGELIAVRLSRGSLDARVERARDVSRSASSSDEQRVKGEG